ncbi:MAG TPA: AMP-binding protein, partial [Polyangiales bacterium]
YGPAGLRTDAISPVYGLAETTLLASYTPRGKVRKTLEFDTSIYEHERRIALRTEGPRTKMMSCGRAIPGHGLEIHDAEGNKLPDGQVGSIMFFGPSRTRGYFGRDEVVPDMLDTGDLGFILDDELYVCGRSKDLIILNGRNLYPQDIEWELEQLPGVRRGSAVAFSVPGEASEQLVVLVEAATIQAEEIAQEAKRCLLKQLGVVPRACQVVTRGSIPKTSSGKLQRSKARELWLGGAYGDVNATSVRLATPPST